MIFSKFVSAFSGPVSEVQLPEGNVDWECELVAVISRPAHRIDRADGWSYVAGVTVGQDLSERVLQRKGPAPQYGLAKSYPGFAPTGPVLVTPDEFANPDDLAITGEVNGLTMQNARTSDRIFRVTDLVAYFSTGYASARRCQYPRVPRRGWGRAVNPRSSLIPRATT